MLTIIATVAATILVVNTIHENVFGYQRPETDLEREDRIREQIRAEG